MTFRAVADAADGTSALRLSGRLDAEALEEFRTAYESCVPPVELDLSQLRSVDEVAAAYLAGLIDAGVRVARSNPYLTTLLRLSGRERVPGARPNGAGGADGRGGVRPPSAT